MTPLVSTAWLGENLHDPSLRILDLRGSVLPPTAPPPHYISDLAGYEKGHIPGAVFVDWLTDFVEPGSPSNDVAPPDQFAELMSRLGVDSATTAVIYDDAGSMFACRLRWALRYYGHKDARVLDGGWQKWVAEGRPISADIPFVQPATFVPRVNARLKANADEILRGLESGGMQLLDVRSPAEFKGVASRAKHGGRIPTAINLPRGVMVSSDMTLKSAAELKEQFAERGISLDAPDTVLYCNSGVSATFGMLAL